MYNEKENKNHALVEEGAGLKMIEEEKVLPSNIKNLENLNVRYYELVNSTYALTDRLGLITDEIYQEFNENKKAICETYNPIQQLDAVKDTYNHLNYMMNLLLNQLNKLA